MYIFNRIHSPLRVLNQFCCMKRTLLFALIACCSIAVDSFSQTVLIQGKSTERKLTWEDFKGTPDATSTFWAYTGYLIRYRYADVKILSDSVTIGIFDVTVELDPTRTWAKMDKVNDELLIHEQGHFNIGILCGREILAAFKQTRFERSNYKDQMQSIFQEILKKYIEMGHQYDSETDHFRNKKEQERWNALIADKLAK